MPLVDLAAYGDESGITNSRYRAISVLSGPADVLFTLRQTLSAELRDADVVEFKWKKLKNAKYKFAAKKLLFTMFPYATRREIRIDTLIWDTYDSRHAIVGRDSIANFERMYYHVLHSSLKRWPRGAYWQIHPDKRNGIDWATLSEVLTAAGRRVELVQTLWGQLLSNPHFTIRSFEARDSASEPLIQVADLFAGMAVYSVESYATIEKWRSTQSPTLFDGDSDVGEFSNADRFRCAFIHDFDQRCKEFKLGVSLRTHRRLRTMKPASPLNFWHYQPQGDYDNAPVRERDP